MFVVFEGLDGSGKSTLMRFFKEELKKRGCEFIETFDPGGTEIGDQIREVLLSKKTKPEDKTELLLYEASRVELVEKVMKPALQQKKWVISDRFYYSTTAFQGYGRGLDLDEVDKLNHFATSGLVPDKVVWVNTPVEECQKRLGKRLLGGEDLSRLDEEKVSFHKKVFEGYTKMSEEQKDSSWLVLDGLLSPEELYAKLKQEFWPGEA